MNIPRSLALGALLVTGFSSAFTSNANDLTNGLVSYWPLNVINGDNTTSDGSFANHLTVVGSPSVAPGTNGNAIVFNGTSQYLSISHGTANTATGLPIYSTGGYTVCLWVKGAAQTAKYLFTEGSTASNNQLLLLQSGNAAGNNTKLDVLLRNDNNTTLLNHVVSTAVVFNNAWHHIAWTDDNGVCKMYVDGNLDSSFAYTNNNSSFSFNTTAVGALVRASASGFFNGTIDDVAVWERVLTASEIQEFRTNGLATPVAARAPAFSKQIPASVTKNVGDWVLYSASAINNRPFTYQWNKNGSPISGATDSTYRVLDLTTNDTGDFYSVTVANDTGNTTSSNSVITVTPDPTPALASGIISYWPLDFVTTDVTTTNTPDLYSGYNMILALMDSNNLVTGNFSNALSFDGFVQYTTRSGGYAVYNNLNYTVSMWVKGDGLTQNDRRVFSEGNSTNANPLFTIGTESAGATQNASVHIRNDANSTLMDRRRSTRVVFDNTWHHLVWTDANGKGKLYIDGHLDETDYTYNRGSLTADRTSLGAVQRSGIGNFYFGAIDETATWSRVLSWTEIQMLFTSGVPAPVAAVPPSIVAHPVDRTNGVFAGDAVSFLVQATGTSPLSYQWLKNGVAISGLSNPSAVTNPLVLPNVQGVDAGSYSVVITNSAGAKTSSIAQLSVTPYTPATNGEVLKLDFGLTGTPNLAPGFSEMNVGKNGTNFNGVGVSISAIGTSLAERARLTAPLVTNSPPFMTQDLVYNDFVFANSTADGTGIRIQIERLATNTTYALTIWSFDPASPGGRVSDWTETASGSPIPIQTGYTFDGAFPPTNDFNNVLGGLVTSSASGKLQIEGVRHGGTSFAVFLDGLRLVANPVPNSRILGTLAAGGNLYVQAVGEYPGQVINFLQSTNLAGGTWVPVDSGGPISTNGMVVTAQFPISPTRMFYRTASPR